MRFTCCDLPGFRGERLVGWGRLWGTEAGDILKWVMLGVTALGSCTAAGPGQALSDRGENLVIFW